MPPLLADFSHARACKPFCEKYLTLPGQVALFERRTHFGDTNFGRKYLNQLPREVIERSNSFGISRYRVKEDYLPK